jgi:serine phosphatase RsbU (regulator of sigma subunit)
MAAVTSTATDGLRPPLAVVAGWALAVVGAGAAVAVARRLDDPLLALAGLALTVVVAASLVGGALAGIGASVVAGLLTWWWLDAPEPPPDGYAMALGVGGSLVALGIGAAAQLRSFDRTRADWLVRLDRLIDELASVSGSEEPLEAVTDAARRATGATAAVLVTPGSEGQPASSSADGQRFVVSSRSTPPLSLELVLPASPPAALADDLTAFLRSVADQCAQALRQTALEQAEARASAHLELLARASSALSATLDPAQVLATVSDLVVPSIADECKVRVASRTGQRRRGAEPPPPDSARTRTVALVAHREVIGHLTVRRRDRDLGAEELAAAELLAEPIGRALDHALLFTEQVHTSSTLEHSLLPEAILPIPDLDVATRYLAAAEGHAAGGDFFDVILTPTGAAVLVVGDVQGKGVEAATLTSAARHTLRAAAMAGSHPAAMLDQLNDALLYGQSERLVANGGEPSIRFVTAAVVALSPTPRGFRAVVASGGHPPPVVIRPVGTVERIMVEGVLLGVFADAHYEETTVELELSDVVVLYTDGVTEQRAQPDLFNDVQLGRLVRNMRTVPQFDADAAAQLILDTVVGLNPREVRDDIALVVARVTGPR